MPGRMLSPTMLRVTSFPFTPNNKPPLSEELKKTISESDDSMMEIEDGAELKEVNKNSQKSEETPKIKVIIKDFARQNIKEKENQPLNSNDNTTEEGEETTEKSDNSEKNDQEGEDQVDCGDSTETEEEFDAPVSPPPSDSSDVILVDDDDEEPPKTVEDANNSAAGNTLNHLFLESEFTPVTQSLWGCSGVQVGVGGEHRCMGGLLPCRGSKSCRYSRKELFGQLFGHYLATWTYSSYSASVATAPKYLRHSIGLLYKCTLLS